jgi:hypothetical protein
MLPLPVFDDQLLQDFMNMATIPTIVGLSECKKAVGTHSIILDV